MEQLDKSSARRHFRQERGRMSPAAHEAAARAFAELVLTELAADSARPGVAAYLSMGLEPSTHHLLPALDEAGYRIVLPVCEPAFQLSWVRWTPEVDLEPSLLAPVREPVGPRRGIDVMAMVGTVVVPALALDTNGNRLGQGGGFYDRFLARLTALPERPRLVGMVYGHELVAPGSFHYSELDIPLDGAVTPHGWHWFGHRNV
jgi:5-formyltetrahydrofolate cyclo-ligase